MEKLKNLFNEMKGIILFYIIVGILTLILTNKVEDINSQAQNEITGRTYYAFNR